MTLKEYIESLPIVNITVDSKSEMIKKISEKTCTTRSTVYKWINGEVQPPLLKQKIIAEMLGKEIETLFPTE